MWKYFIFFLIPFFVYSESKLSFSDLASSKISEKEGQTVIIRGFLYQEISGQYILASEPNLKSCCVGNAQNSNRQIAVLGSLPKQLPKSAITVKGVFSAESKFLLKDAEVLPEDGIRGKLFWGSLLLILLASSLYLIYRANKGDARETLAISVPRNFCPSKRNFSGLSLTKNR